MLTEIEDSDISLGVDIIEKLIPIAAFIAAVSLAAFVMYLRPVLMELRHTLATYRSLEPKIIALLDHSRRVTSNVEEITRQVLTQSGRIDHMTGEASEMVDKVKKTVDLYNRTIARPVIMAASIASGLKGVSSVLFKKRKRGTE